MQGTLCYVPVAEVYPVVEAKVDGVGFWDMEKKKV
jgi:hypothetical protein